MLIRCIKISFCRCGKPHSEVRSRAAAAGALFLLGIGPTVCQVFPNRYFTAASDGIDGRLRLFIGHVYRSIDHPDPANLVNLVFRAIYFSSSNYFTLSSKYEKK